MSSDGTLSSVLCMRKRYPCIGQKVCGLCLSWSSGVQPVMTQNPTCAQGALGFTRTAQETWLTKVIPTLLVRTAGSGWPKCPWTRITDTDIVTGWNSSWNVWAWPRFIAGIYLEDKWSTEKNEWNDMHWVMTICRCWQAHKNTRLCVTVCVLLYMHEYVFSAGLLP